jgi:peptidoglycan/xylan/chitin deacetylase (PgdA/CDA1 family)
VSAGVRRSLAILVVVSVLMTVLLASASGPRSRPGAEAPVSSPGGAGKVAVATRSAPPSGGSRIAKNKDQWYWTEKSSSPPTAPVSSASSEQVDCAHVACVALTFDDGPGLYTGSCRRDQSLVHATFFVLGRNVVSSPQVVSAERTAGHEVGNHSWSHPNLTRRGAAAVSSQLNRTDDAILAATGEIPTLVRPPFGAVNAAGLRRIARPVILWDVDPQDWKIRNRDHVVNAVLGAVQPGDIVLLHDIYLSTVEAVPRIIQVLRRRGYHFVTVSQLLSGTGGPRLTAGKIYGKRER